MKLSELGFITALTILAVLIAGAILIGVHA